MRSTHNIHSAAECIRTVSRHYGISAVNIPSATNPDGIIQVLKSLDFYACDLHTNMRGLVDCPKPAIVQTITGFMTLLDANKINVKIIYGDNEVHRIAFMDFIKVWTGLVIVIEPPPTRKWSFFGRFFN
jgi:ABC-type bacteriocin/lantibiotic exporter with double-glycine peptidase domain